MKRWAVRWLWVAVGWGMLLLGVAGLVLPFLHGVIFLILGLLILSTEYIWAARLLGKLRSRFPRFGGLIERMQLRVNAWKGIAPPAHSTSSAD